MLKTTVAAALAAVLGMGGPAYAADMSGGRSLKDAPMYDIPPICWTGFYVAAGGGYGATKSNMQADITLTGVAAGSVNVNGLGGMGGFGSIQVGYDIQAARRFVVGAFFDYDFAAINSSVSGSVANTTYTGATNFNLTDSWTAGGRGGYLVTPATLAYVLGGYTEAHFSLPPLAQHSDFGGWTVGAGMEANLGGPLYLKGEYRYTQLDRQTLWSGTYTGYGSFNITDQPDVQTGRMMLVYKFGSFGLDPLPSLK